MYRLIIAAVPSVIAGGNAFAPFIIGLLLLAFGTGFIKSSVAPLMADQVESKVQKIKTLPSGERVIVDPATTVSSIMLVSSLKLLHARRHSLCLREYIELTR